MSEENVEIVRQVYGAVARRDPEVVLAFYDPEVEVDASRIDWGVMGRDVYYGHDGLRSLYRGWYEAWENYREDLEELIDAGEKVFSVATHRASGRTSGVEVELAAYGVWTVQEGKIIRVAWLPSRAEALEAAGLSKGNSEH